MTVAAVSQLVLFLDSVGTLRAEMPAGNGARRKIDLPANFLKRNPEIATALRDDQERQKHDAQRLTQLATLTPTSLDAIENLKSQRLSAMDRESIDRWFKWSKDTIAAEKLQGEIEKRLEKAKADSDERAKRIWLTVAQRHGVKLANHVIQDPNRRPRIARQVMDLALAIDL